ncbi:MAG: hypothetical protein JXQ73_13540 [Phycisphaerae bacterium]|nr:hypothetical protein [Phycisphaerae bacterium]
MKTSARRLGLAVGAVASLIAITTTGCSSPESKGAGHHWRVVPQDGVSAFFFDSRPEGKDTSAPLPMLFFSKKGSDRRLVPLEIERPELSADTRAIELEYELFMMEGREPKLALLLFDKQGGAWLEIRQQPLLAHYYKEREEDVKAEWARRQAHPDSRDMMSSKARLPLNSLRRAAFSGSETTEIDWSQVDRAWIGMILDDPALGGISIESAKFTTEPFRPTKPMPVVFESKDVWAVGKDPSVQAELTTPNEGPSGKQCMRFDFTFPIGRHMYALPMMPLSEAEYDGYAALRFTYKATLPAGIDGLLVTLFEQDGGQYVAKPPPPASQEWRTVTIPLKDFKLGEWSRDGNARFDPGTINRLSIGLHGSARSGSGKGAILVTDIEFVPQDVEVDS